MYSIVRVWGGQQSGTALRNSVGIQPYRCTANNHVDIGKGVAAPGRHSADVVLSRRKPEETKLTAIIRSNGFYSRQSSFPIRVCILERSNADIHDRLARRV